MNANNLSLLSFPFIFLHPVLSQGPTYIPRALSRKPPPCYKPLSILSGRLWKAVIMLAVWWAPLEEYLWWKGYVWALEAVLCSWLLKPSCARGGYPPWVGRAPIGKKKYIGEWNCESSITTDMVTTLLLMVRNKLPTSEQALCQEGDLVLGKGKTLFTKIVLLFHAKGNQIVINGWEWTEVIPGWLA